MNKTELIKQLAEKSNISIDNTRVVINNLLIIIQDTLNKGEQVSIQGLGKFYLKEYGKRRITTPQGKEVVLEKRLMPSFKMSNSLKNSFLSNT